MKTLAALAFLIIALSAPLPSAHGQGNYVNLDFESANLPVVPNGQSGGQVAATDGIPGWAAYYGTNQTSQILHNNFSLGGSVNISIFGPDWGSRFGISVIEGNYSALVQAGFGGFGNISASIAQTSLIPITAQSIQLKANSIFANPGSQFGLSIGGQDIALVLLMSTANYKLYGGDISSFAGLTEELRIAALTSTYAYSSFVIDSIVFSPEAIPEPGVFGLLAVGSLLLGWRFFSKRR